jgi:DNA-binding transcriptional MerR regulator
MAEPEKQGRSQESAGEERYYTLSEVSEKSGISMPTLQRYKKAYQNRIPSRGKGRKQRYPESALPVFEQIKQENIGRRGRPRKEATAQKPAARKGAAQKPAVKERAAAKRAGGRKAAPPPARGGRGRKAAGSKRRGTEGLLTLTQISEETGISYPTLVRYVRLFGEQIPSEGQGRARRFHPEAVDVFRRLRQESGRGGRRPAAAKPAKAAKGAKPGRRGRPPAAAAEGGPGLEQRLRSLEKSHQDLDKKLRSLVKNLERAFG